MAYNDAILNEADRAKVKALGEQWQAAKAAGDTQKENEKTSATIELPFVPAEGTE